MRPHIAKDTYWQRTKSFITEPAFVIPTLLGIALAAITTLVTDLSVPRKSPRYAVIKDTIDLSSTAKIPGFEFAWKGRQIASISEVSVGLWNGGKEPLDASDFPESDPLRIVASTPVQILYIRQPLTSRSTLRFDLEPSSEPIPAIVVRLKGSDAMEYGEGGEFQITFTGNPQARFTVQGRVKGVPGGFQEQDWFALVRSGVDTWRRDDTGCLPYELRIYPPSPKADSFSAGTPPEPLSIAHSGDCSIVKLLERIIH